MSLFKKNYYSTNDGRCVCTDEPENCHFAACNPSSLCRHRKDLHNYTPRSKGGNESDSEETQNKGERVPVRVIHDVEPDQVLSV